MNKVSSHHTKYNFTAVSNPTRKNLDHHAACVGVCEPVLFKRLNYLTDFQETWYENHVIDRHTNVVFSGTQRSVITT